MTAHTRQEAGFIPAPAPLNEAARLDTLRAMGVMDTPAEAAFDDITRIAAYVCRTPVALISLVDESRQWFKSALGTDVSETPRDYAFCGHALLQSGLMEVRDAQQDERFAGNPLVTGDPHIRFYAGAPLVTAEGHALGTVCVLDTEPRTLDDDQRAVLAALARQTMAQLELRRALGQAERANRHRGRLMAVAGHDLKQPLQILTMAADRLSAVAQTQRDRDRAAAAMQSARVLSAELDDLARASRADDDDDQPDMAPVAADLILKPLAGNWSHAAERKGLTLVVEPCGARIVTDAAMLSTILNNLVGNAVKYTDAGEVRVGGRVSGDALVITVADTGRGIAADDVTRIFEAFNQVDPKADGLGLGLAIVRRTAEMLGHKLALKSALGEGSTFTIEVPLAR